MRFDTCYASPAGNIFISEENGKICRISYTEPQNYMPVTDLTPLLCETLTQMKEYFAGRRRIFVLPLSLIGTTFQKNVWKVLLTIPYGQTVSYQDIAAAVGNPSAVRAVGQANHRNPINIVIPCHRVVGKNGTPAGYSGGLFIKKYLLTLEKDVVNA